MLVAYAWGSSASTWSIALGAHFDGVRTNLMSAIALDRTVRPCTLAALRDHDAIDAFRTVFERTWVVPPIALT